MDELKKIIRKEFICIDYGQFEGFQDDITLESLIRLKAALDLAIHYNLIDKESQTTED